MARFALKRMRRATPRLPARQLGMVLIAAGVIAAMVAVTTAARHEADRHQRVQALAQDVRATSQEVNALVWQLDARSIGASQQLDPADLRRGLTLWSSFEKELGALAAADPGPQTARLEQEADALFSAGMQARALGAQDGALGSRYAASAAFDRALDAIDRDSEHAAAAQARVASAASTRSTIAYISSLVLGLAALLVLGWRLHLIRRSALLAEEQLRRRSEQRIDALVEHSSDVFSVVDTRLAVRWQSASVERMLGHDAQTFVGRPLCDLVHPDDAPAVESALATARSRPGNVTVSARLRHAAGEWRHVEAIAENRLADPAVEGLVLSMRDMTDRKALEDELRHQAFHDALTGLANRSLFEDRLAHALAAARRYGRGVAVLFVDLDDFKTVNDSLGHVRGDELLCAAALRITGVIRPTDTAARLGGDEFAVLVDPVEGERHTEIVARRILDALAAPFQVAGRDLTMRASIGAALSDGSVGMEELLRNADTAMYAAKDAGKSTVRAFEEGMHRRAVDRLELTGELERALKLGEFELDYQPIVSLDTGRMTGAEALVRWAHPQRGRLAPAHFIALAEETGLIVQLGAWVLRAACAEAREWQTEFPEAGPLQMSVNVSTRQLHDAGFVEMVMDALEATRLDPTLLILEITESLLADDGDESIDRLKQLKAIGVRVAVDDFGTGYSALSRIQHFPIDVLKIDRSFIDGIELDSGKARIVRGIVNLGESLGFDVVAEGVEEQEQVNQLREMHSPFAQGYLFSRPVAREDLRALFATGLPLYGMPVLPTDAAIAHAAKRER